MILKQKGVTMVEYAMMVALITIVALVSVKFLGQTVSAVFQNAGNSYPSSTG